MSKPARVHVKLHELQVAELQKKIIEGETKLKQQQNLSVRERLRHQHNHDKYDTLHDSGLLGYYLLEHSVCIQRCGVAISGRRTRLLCNIKMYADV